MYRHGDLLIIPTQIPRNAVRQKAKRLVLAEGEVTGHAHVITDPGASLYDLVSAADVEEMRRRFLKVTNEVALTHEEHKTLTIPPGEYEVIRQVEYAPEALRVVGD